MIFGMFSLGILICECVLVCIFMYGPCVSAHVFVGTCSWVCVGVYRQDNLGYHFYYSSATFNWFVFCLFVVVSRQGLELTN